MSQATAVHSTQADILDHADDWLVHLRAAHRSPATIDTYYTAVRLFDEFLAEKGMPRGVASIRREHVEAFQVDLIERRSPGTAANRHRSLKQYFRFLIAEGLIKKSPMVNVELPQTVENPPPVLTDDQLSAILDTCRRDTSFEGRRDFAILQLLIRTGIRRAELIGLRYNVDDPNDPDSNDFDRAAQVINVTGKGRRERPVFLDNEATIALTRYLRVRKEHPRADLTALWLGHRGPLGATGVFQMIRRRARQAKLGRTFTHLFRHSAAHFDMAAGMSESDVMRKYGWRSPSMVRRYGASAATERSLASQKRLARGRL